MIRLTDSNFFGQVTGKTTFFLAKASPLATTMFYAFLMEVALNGLENILRLGEQESKQSGAANPYAVIIEEVFGLDKIEFLQSHENIEIYQKAFDIIERYFGTEEEDKEVGLDS